MTDDPTPGRVRRPGRDKRVNDPIAHLYDREVEAMAMVRLWRKSRNIYARSELAYWEAELAQARAEIAALAGEGEGGA